MCGKIVDSSIRGVRYTISLPERIIRSLTALLGGVLKESSDFLIPDVLKSSTSYQIFIGNLLRYGVENIGRVKGVYEDEGKMDNDYGVKKMVGNGVELVGVVAVSASPLWVLAFLSDALYGVDTYFKQIAEELDKDDHTEEKERFEKRGDFLDSVVNFSNSLARNIDTPPLTKAELKENFDEIREYYREIGEKMKISREDIDTLWARIEATAKSNDRTITEISGAVTVHMMNRVRSMRHSTRASGRVGSRIIHEDILAYYRDALGAIDDRGYITVVKEEFTPYLKRSVELFNPDEQMLTDRIVSREVLEYFGEWNAKRGERKEKRLKKLIAREIERAEQELADAESNQANSETDGDSQKPRIDM
jgi:hypothetical protein